MLNSVQARLSLALIPVVAFFIMLGSAVWLVSASTSNDIGETVRKNTLVSAQVEELSILAQQIRRYEKEYFIYSGDAEGRVKYRKEWSQTHLKIDEQIKAMRDNAQSLFSAQDLADLQKGGEALAFYAAEMNKIFKSVDEKALAVEQYVAPTPQQIKAAAKSGKTLDPAPRMLSPAEANALIKEGKDRFGAELKGMPIDGDDEIQIKEFRSLAQAVTRMSVAQKMLLERVKRARAAA